jgi:hypothetical protein
MIVFLAVNCVCVGLRVYVRTVISKSFSYDDYAMILAFAGFVVLCACTFVSIKAGYADDQPNPAYDVVTAVKFFVISTIEYVIVVFIAKVSVALVLYRLASQHPIVRRVLEASVGIMAVWTLVSSVIVGLQCRPLSFAWGVGEGTCLDPAILGNVGFSISAMDIVSSFLYAGLPIFLLRGVQLSPKMKISVIFLLGMGVVSSVATLLRLKYLIDVANMTSATGVEAMNAYLTTFVFSIIELGLTIFTASLAALRPLLKLIPWGSIGTTQGQSYKKSANSRNDMGPGIKLNDMPDPKDNSSEEFMVPRGKVVKRSDYTVTYTAM